MTDINNMIEQLYPEMVEWRRDFHKYAESGWVEFRTASLVAARLEQWGFEVKAGEEVIDKDSRMGVPQEDFLRRHEARAEQQGADMKWLPRFSGGFTGVVGILDTGRPGPTIGYRFDMDALDIQESNDQDHQPFADQFASVNDGMMHACGHDAHTSIGLGLAKLLSAIKSQLNGRIKMIFQPSEEGVRGAKSMVEAGVLDDVDVLFASHIGTGVPLGEVVCGSNGFLSTTKMDVSFTGVASHAGAKPEEGKNALLAAATAALNLHSIPRHSGGASRVNVGVLNAGSGRNVVPASAHLKLETRGETAEINRFMFENAQQVIKGAAQMYDVEAKIDIVGAATSCNSSPELAPYIRSQAEQVDTVKSIQDISSFAAGSEDATYMLDKVKSNGGLASYAIFGTTLAAGHHNEKFDFDESVMIIALKTLALAAINIEQLAKDKQILSH
ncbi:M20 family metallo-hydrolase [Scopulibacillus cellulosilyticus]|uniref:M20 family metallo-hydrolase n=1 Tax=Scopulibacillus cellulosilyticus TaxID=2665665 RepID=A0ABW2Q076_9BACL